MNCAIYKTTFYVLVRVCVPVFRTRPERDGGRRDERLRPGDVTRDVTRAARSAGAKRRAVAAVQRC